METGIRTCRRVQEAALLLGWELHLDVVHVKRPGLTFGCGPADRNSRRMTLVIGRFDLGWIRGARH